MDNERHTWREALQLSVNSLIPRPFQCARAPSAEGSGDETIQ